MSGAKSDLSDNHRRSLSVTCKIVERVMVEIEDLLTGIPRQMLTSHLESTYEPNQREYLLKNIQRMRELNQQMFEALDLQSEFVSERRIVESKLNHLWVILEDSKPEHLTGFGTLSPQTAREVNEHVQMLLNTVSLMLRYSISSG